MIPMDNSTPIDFAYERPSSTDHFKSQNPKSDAIHRANSFSTTQQFTPQSTTMSAANSFPFSTYGLGSASSFSSNSFSSASGSAAGSSFSSVDALPAISREFTRPSPEVTKRPATAHGVLQSRSPFAGFMPGSGSQNDRFTRKDSMVDETIDEAGEGVFTDPFASPQPESSSDPKLVPSQVDVDPLLVPPSRRASEPQPPPAQKQNMFAAPQIYNNPMTTAAPNVPQSFNTVTPNNLSIRHTPYYARPQTSDGIPSFPSQLNGSISLPSARTIAGHVFQSPAAPTGHINTRENNPEFMPFRDARSSASNDRAYSIDSNMKRNQNQQQVPPAHRSSLPANVYTINPKDTSTTSYDDDGGSDDMTFVPLGGPVHKKRPRRRFNEIERLYACGYGGCEKAYGTLNHLNAHVAMQKHGEKRLPSEFKDLRKAWRKRKREQQAAMANNQYWNGPRGSIGSISASSESDDATRRMYGSSAGTDFDRRDSSSSMTAATDLMHRGSVYSNPSTSYGSTGPGWMTNNDDSRPNTSSSMISSVDERFNNLPPISNVSLGPPPVPRQVTYFTPNAGPYYTPIPQQVSQQQQHLPQQRRQSMHMTLPSGFRQDQYQTPTQLNPHPESNANGDHSGFQHGRSNGSHGGGGFPFLTSGVNVDSTLSQGYPGQFAFNR